MTAGTLAWIAAVAIPLSALAAAPEKDYEIKLHRPLKVGQQFKESAVGRCTKRQINQEPGTPPVIKKEEFTVELESEDKVLEVDKNGVPCRVALTVDKCDRLRGDERKPLLPKGAVLMASAGNVGSVSFEVEGKPVAPEVEDALQRVFQLNRDLPTNDEVFGTARRRKVGDSWPINAEVFAKAITKQGLTVGPENVAGSARLVRTCRVDGADCLEAEVWTRIDLPRPEAPQEGPAKWQLYTLYSVTVPVAGSMGIVAETATQRSTTIMTPPESSPLQGSFQEFSVETHTTHKYTYPK